MGRPHHHALLGVRYARIGEFPLKLYVYRMDGFHEGYTYLETEADLRLFLAVRGMLALEDGREVRITDPDDYMVYWIKDGKVLWNGEGELPKNEEDIVVKDCTCDEIF